MIGRQLGTRVHKGRVRRKLTQQALGSIVVTGQKTNARIENGHAGAKPDTLMRVVVRPVGPG